MNAIDTLARESSTSNAITTSIPTESTDLKHEQPVIITGMHKSGTSLTSSVLQASGVHIGENLMGPGPGNRLGHFEDMELYALHCHALVFQDIHMDGWTSQSRVSMPQQFLSRVQHLLEHRQKSPRLWGWKDPRTTLFLDFWKQTLLSAKFVFVYRNPWEVVDSLYRRGDSMFDNHPNAAIEAWITYNTAILEFCKHHPADTFLFDVANYCNGEKRILSHLCSKLEITLDMSCPPRYRDSELHTIAASTHRPAILQKCFPQALDLYEKLGQMADMPFLQTADVAQASIDESYQFECLQDWAKLRRIQGEQKTTHEDLQAFQDQLQQYLLKHENSVV